MVWKCESPLRDLEGGRIISRVGHPHRRDAPPVWSYPSLSLIENGSKREYDANTTQAPSRLSGPGLEVAKKRLVRTGVVMHFVPPTQLNLTTRYLLIEVKARGKGVGGRDNLPFWARATHAAHNQTGVKSAEGGACCAPYQRQGLLHKHTLLQTVPEWAKASTLFLLMQG